MDKVKAKLALLLIGLIWGSLILLMFLLLLVVIVYDALVGTHSVRGWTYSLLLAQDHLVNAILGGHYKTTISALLGYLQLSGSRTGGIVAAVVDWGFRMATGEIGHCVNAMRPTDVYNWSSSRALLGALIYFSGVYAIGALLCN